MSEDMCFVCFCFVFYLEKRAIEGLMACSAVSVKQGASHAERGGLGA